MSVEVQDLVVRFGEKQVLNKVSCQFSSGALTALVGPSGTGKSTLLGVISGSIQPDAGKVQVDAQTPNPLFAVWVPQGANALNTRTALDNVKIAPLSEGLSRLRAHAIARQRLREVGLEDQMFSMANQLSGGELQRLAFARALASSRPLLLADEPTANLDLASTQEIVSLLRSIRTKRTVIVATHDPEVVRASDAVVDLRRLNLASL